MKKMMKLMMVAGLIFFTNEIAAQEKIEKVDANGDRIEMTPEQKAKQRTDKMKKELGLNEAQEKDIYAINLTHALEMQKLHAEQKALKEKMKAERESTEQKIKAVLTAEQIVLFDQKKEEMKAKREAHRNEHKH